jgi:DNA-dependent RNA polymerase-like protein
MLTLDQQLLSMLNIKEATILDKPEDFYTIIGNCIKGYIEKILTDNNADTIENFDSYKRLNNINIHRAVIKKSIMTMPYNVSPIQSIKYLKENFIEVLDNNLNENITTNQVKYKDRWFTHINDNSIKLKDYDFVILYKILSEVLIQMTPSIKLVTDYLKNLADICSSANIPIP